MTRKQRTSGTSAGDGVRRPSRQAWPTDVRLAVARAVVDQHLSTREVAKRFGVGYTTAIEWCSRYRNGGSAALEPAVPSSAARRRGEDDPRRRAIRSVQAQQPQAGSRRIRDVMRRFLGLGTSATTVRRVLREEQVRPPAAPRLKPRPRPAPTRFERAKPNQL